MAKREKRTYYWIVGYKSDGSTPLITYGGETEHEARAEGFKMFQSTSYDIFPYPSRNQQDVTAAWKRTRLMETGDPDKAMKRASHQSEKREQIEYY